MGTTARFLLVTASAFALLCTDSGGRPCIAESPLQMAAGPATPNAVSLVVCAPQTFEDCHRVEGVVPPRVIHSETPVYPLAARRLKLEGISAVSLVIDPHGVPRNVSVAHSIADSVPAQHQDVAMQMDKSAVACVKKFRFVAATLDGKPVATQVVLKMNFHHTTAK